MTGDDSRIESATGRPAAQATGEGAGGLQAARSRHGGTPAGAGPETGRPAASKPALVQDPQVLDPTRDPFSGRDVTPGDLGRVHFIGIGGAGMSVLAEMLKQGGADVCGSDMQASARTARLEAMGIPVRIGQAAGNVDGADTVVWSTAIKPDNPEIVEARARGIRLVHRSDILALLMSSRRAVTVAGAHGKTTTSALLAHILSKSGQGGLADPSYAIGGSLRMASGLVEGGHLGRGDVLVAEADESDGSFEKYHPLIGIITNVEADHLDHYGSPDAFRRAFVEHARHVTGSVIICGDDPGAREVIDRLGEDCRAGLVVYSTEAEEDFGPLPAAAGYVRIESESEAAGSGEERFVLSLPASLVGNRPSGPGGREGEGIRLPVHLSIPGLHNARNAAAAITAAVILGMEPGRAACAAEDFQGAARRFDLRGVQGSVSVVDDYAHHPTEIRALIDAARRRYPGRRLRILFQPHLFSRTRFFARQFAQALSRADDVVVTAIYPAREKQEDFPDVGPQTIIRAADDADRRRFQEVDDMEEAARILADRAQAGDVILTVGAGDVTAMAQVILDRLAQGKNRDTADGLGAADERSTDR